MRWRGLQQFANLPFCKFLCFTIKYNHRASNGMVLTQAGIVYLQHVQKMAQADEQIAQLLQAPTGILTGRLRLGSNKTILAYWLPDILARFKTRYPAAVCEIIDGNMDTIIGALLDQRIDLALIEGPCRRPEIQMQTALILRRVNFVLNRRVN